jgi:hypothetical protein
MATTTNCCGFVGFLAGFDQRVHYLDDVAGKDPFVPNDQSVELEHHSNGELPEWALLPVLNHLLVMIAHQDVAVEGRWNSRMARQSNAKNFPWSWASQKIALRSSPREVT